MKELLEETTQIILVIVHRCISRIFKRNIYEQQAFQEFVSGISHGIGAITIVMHLFIKKVFGYECLTISKFRSRTNLTDSRIRKSHLIWQLQFPGQHNKHL